MKFEAVTIKDIAKALGLSTSTVSRALRDSHEISIETKKLVMEYAEKINYHPNPIALSLKERKSRTIGVIVCEIANPFFSQVINGIESVAHESGYNVIIAQSHESFQKEVRDLQYLTSRSIDGLIVSVSVETNDFAHINQVFQKGLPVVFFDRIVNEIDTHKVIVDNYKGTYEATKHLINNGCRNIGALAIAPFLSITRERIAGYKAALTDGGISFDEKLIQHLKPGPQLKDDLEVAVKSLLELNPKPDSIIGLSDKLTTGCLRILKKEKIKVPEDISLIGFSNSELTDLIDPPLSIIKQPAFEMGEVSTRLLLQMIESKRPITDFFTKALTPELVINESSDYKRPIKKNDTVDA
jgi:DNA-binding LacI/PurR family transcriptional regulator